MTYTPHWDPNNIPDLTGKVAIVTGGNAGIGFETSYFLASRNATVYIAARNEKRANDAIDRLQARLKANKIDTKVYYHYLDLASIKGSKESAEDFLKKENRLDILICNAGVMMEKWTEDHLYEPMFTTNHISHFAFVTTLLPLVEKTAAQTKDARIIITCSDAHKFVKGIDYTVLTQKPANVKLNRKWGDLGAGISLYGQSKLANIWFAQELDRRLREEDPNAKHIWVNSPHPGMIASSNLGYGADDIVPQWIYKIVKLIAGWLSLSFIEGASTQTYIATSPEIPEHNVHGEYFSPNLSWFMAYRGPQVEDLASVYKNDEERRKLWDWTEEAIRNAIENEGK